MSVQQHIRAVERIRAAVVLAALFLFMLTAGRSQVRISFGQQGAEELRVAAGRVIKGVGIGSLDVCLIGGPRTLDSGIVYSEIRKLGVSTILPIEATPMLEHSAGTSWAQTGVDISGGVSAGLGLAGLTKGLKMSNGWAIGLLLFPEILSGAKKLLSKRLPTPKPTEDNLLKGKYPLTAGECIPGSVFLYHYTGKWTTETKEVIIP